MNKPKKQNSLKKVIVWTTIIIILIFLFLLRVWSWDRVLVDSDYSIDYDAYGTFGDFIGGFIGTIFAIYGVVFVYFTYMNQIESQKIEQIKRDREINQIERTQAKEQIESRFFELLKLHQENLTNLKKIDDDIFSLYIKNIRNFTKIIKKYNDTKNNDWKPDDIIELGYLYFFYGVSEFTEERLINKKITTSQISDLNLYIKKQGFEYKASYKDLGIYFRQLFQIVNFIDSKTILTYPEKYEYIKTLRVRLNIEEQYLLFLNSLVASGLNWELGFEIKDDNKKLITKYNLLKNIPKEFAQIEEIDFKIIYPNIQYEFNGKMKLTKRMELERMYS